MVLAPDIKDLLSLFLFVDICQVTALLNTDVDHAGEMGACLTRRCRYRTQRHNFGFDLELVVQGQHAACTTCDYVGLQRGLFDDVDGGNMTTLMANIYSGSILSHHSGSLYGKT